MNQEPYTLIQRYGTDIVIESLSSSLTEERKTRIDSMLENRMHTLQLAVEQPHDIHNAVAIVRSSEALGVNHIHLIDEDLRRNKGKGTVKGASKWTHVNYYPLLQNFMSTRKERKFLLAGACLKGDLSLEELPIDQPICLLFGNEHRGLSPQALECCDITYRIPMFGMMESFNLSVSAAISIYDVLKRKRKLLGRNSDLTPKELECERAWAYIQAIGPERAQSMIKHVALL